MKIHTVDKIDEDALLDTWVGMNFYSAQALGIKWKFGKDDIAVKSGLSKNEKQEVIAHEKKERDLMKTRHWSYPRAHAETRRLVA